MSPNNSSKRLNQALKVFGSSICFVAVTACSSGGDSDSQDVGSITLESETEDMIIDASDYEAYRYLNLVTGELVTLSEAEANTSQDWHLAFRRTAIKLNGGTSGPGNVSGALSSAQEDFYDADGNPDTNIFLNATPSSESEHLDPDTDLSSLDFIVDSFSTAIQGSQATIGTEIDMGWYRYNFVTHQTSLNSDNWWLIRSNSGTSYAKFHATEFSYDSVTGLEVSFEFDIQNEGTDTFVSNAAFFAQVDAAGGEDCFDIDTGTSVDCASNTWDLKLEIEGRSWNLWTNGGVSGDGSGGAFGPFETADADEYTSGNLSPSGTDITSHYTSDSSAGIFNENSWYAYNLSGGHKLWPNYRTYVIDTDSSDADSDKYLLQITNYYSDTGVSGNPNISYVKATTN